MLGAARSPDKANPPLIVDADTVLARAAAAQGFQPIARRRGKVRQAFGGMQLPQLALRDALHVLGQAARKPAMEKPLGIPVSEGTDHRGLIYAMRSV